MNTLRQEHEDHRAGSDPDHPQASLGGGSTTNPRALITQKCEQRALKSEPLSSSTGYLGNIVLDKKRLRLLALALGIGFMITVVMRIFYPM